MRHIGGLVLVKETGRGIPNLEVKVFDSDLTIEDIRHREFPAGMVQRAGTSICSVLTDRHGRFVISREDLEFPGNETRPDLLLMVLAPEDVLNPTRPVPLPDEERLLYVSTVPRVNAGAEQAYVIRLLQKRLDHFGIDTLGVRDVDADIRTLAAPSLRAAHFNDGMRDALAERRKALREATNETRRVHRAKIAALSAIPSHLRDERARRAGKLIEGKAELPKQLATMQRDVVEDAVKGMRKLKTSPTMRFYISDRDVAALGLTVKGDSVEGRVPAAKLRETLPGFSNVTDLIRARGTEAPSLDELERRYLLAEDNSSTNGASAPANPK